jgi:hypothetical protein
MDRISFRDYADQTLLRQERVGIFRENSQDSSAMSDNISERRGERDPAGRFSKKENSPPVGCQAMASQAESVPVTGWDAQG